MSETYGTQETVRQMLHISKRKAKYILDNGIIPCINTGKKTRQYRVKISDIKHYMEHPYNFDVGMFPSNTKPKSIKKEALLLDEDVVYTYFYKMLSNENDMLTIIRISELTGYGKPTIYRWINKSWLKSILFLNKHLIPKEELLKFLISPTFTTLPQKSPKHLQQIAEIKQQMQLTDNKKQ